MHITLTPEMDELADLATRLTNLSKADVVKIAIDRYYSDTLRKELNGDNGG